MLDPNNIVYVSIGRINAVLRHTHRHWQAYHSTLYPEHPWNLLRIRRTTLKIRPQLPIFPPMPILRPADILSKPFRAAIWVKQEDSAELVEQTGLRRCARIGDPYP